MKTFLTKCNQCGQTTSKTYARKNQGWCKSCVTGTPREERHHGDRPVCHGEMTHSFLATEASLDSCPW